MIEVSYYKTTEFVGIGLKPFMIVAVSIPFQWDNTLRLSIEDIEEVSASKYQVNYSLNLVIMYDNFKHLTGGALMSLVETILFNKDLFRNYFESGRISVRRVKDANSRAESIFKYSTRIGTRYLNIDENKISELIGKKIKKNYDRT